jgi:hypothetical protein
MRLFLFSHLLLIALFAPRYAIAGDAAVRAPSLSVSHIGVHLHTFHSNQINACARWQNGWDGWAPYEHDCTDSTPGVYMRLNGRWLIGYYRNSIQRDSFYAGRTFTLVDRGWVQVELTAGLLSGYKPGRVGPLLLPAVSFPISERTRFQVVPIPKIPGKHGPAALHLALEFRL